MLTYAYYTTSQGGVISTVTSARNLSYLTIALALLLLAGCGNGLGGDSGTGYTIPYTPSGSNSTAAASCLQDSGYSTWDGTGLYIGLQITNTTGPKPLTTTFCVTADNGPYDISNMVCHSGKLGPDAGDVKLAIKPFQEVEVTYSAIGNFIAYCEIKDTSTDKANSNQISVGVTNSVSSP